MLFHDGVIPVTSNFENQKNLKKRKSDHRKIFDSKSYQMLPLKWFLDSRATSNAKT